MRANMQLINKKDSNGFRRAIRREQEFTNAGMICSARKTSRQCRMNHRRVQTFATAALKFRHKGLQVARMDSAGHHLAARMKAGCRG